MIPIQSDSSASQSNYSLTAFNLKGDHRLGSPAATRSEIRTLLVRTYTVSSLQRQSEDQFQGGKGEDWEPVGGLKEGR